VDASPPPIYPPSRMRVRELRASANRVRIRVPDAHDKEILQNKLGINYRVPEKIDLTKSKKSGIFDVWGKRPY